MAGSWTDELGLKELGERLGKGGSIGLAVGGGAALVAAMTGMVGGWLGWLLVPIAAVMGMVAGDAITKDGYVFGEKGVLKALETKNAPKKIPEGYIAAEPYSMVTAVSSEALARHGEVHMFTSKYPDEVLFGFKDIRPLDAFVEFNIKDDPRLEALKIKAKEHGRKYAGADSPDYIADVHKREKTIVDLIVKDIGETYGMYSYDTLNWGNSAEHRANYTPRSIILGGRTIELKEVAKGSLVCRHYAPIASVLLHEAHVPNHTVSSFVRRVKNIDGSIQIDETCKIAGQPTNHMYVVTDQGNAIVEATVTGQENANWAAYKPILNGVTVRDIIYKGKAAIAGIPTGKRSFIYGGHGGDGIAEPSKSMTNSFTASMIPEGHLSAVKKAMQQSIDAYNEEVKKRKAKAETASPAASAEKTQAELGRIMHQAAHQFQAIMSGLKTLMPSDVELSSSPVSPVPTSPRPAAPDGALQPK